MKFKLCFLFLWILCPFSFTQVSKVNEFQVFDGEAEYAYRPFLRTGQGEILQKVPFKFFGSFGVIKGIRAVIQDQNASTSETVWVVIRKADSTGKPDISSQGIILKKGPYRISGQGTGSRAWNFYFSFSNTITPPKGDFYYGVLLSPGRSNSDFTSVHMSGDYPNNKCGEHPRKGVVPNLAWKVVYSGGKPASTSSLSYNLAWDMGLLFDKPVMQAYSVDPKSKCLKKRNLKDFGYAGVWPDLLDKEGYGYKAKIGWRIRDINQANKNYVKGFIFLSSKKLLNPYYIPGFGYWYLDPNDPWFGLVIVVSFDYFGDGKTNPFDLPDIMRNLLIGTDLFAQSLIYNPILSSFCLTSFCGMNF